MNAREQAHASFCTDHAEGICRADDLAAGKWEIGLSAVDGEATVYVWHPEILPDETSGTLRPAEAIELGRALVAQGTLGLLQGGHAASSDAV
jgi:hypothetical protein